MSRNNSPARRAQRAAAAAVRGQAPTILGEAPTAEAPTAEAPAELSDRVLRRLCWRARGRAWKAGWR